jgi:hypothetical protein
MLPVNQSKPVSKELIANDENRIIPLLQIIMQILLGRPCMQRAQEASGRRGPATTDIHLTRIIEYR